MGGGLIGDPIQGVLLLGILVLGVWTANDLFSGSTTTLPGRWSPSRTYNKERDPGFFWGIVIVKSIIVVSLLGTFLSSF